MRRLARVHWALLAVAWISGCRGDVMVPDLPDAPDARPEYPLESCTVGGVDFCGPDLCDGDCVPCDMYTLRHGGLVSGICRDYDNVWAGLFCSACRTDDVCTLQSWFGALDGDGLLTCASRTVCDILWDRGVDLMCLFTDKSEYRRNAVIDTLPCPDLTELHPCGGECGDCGVSGLECTGRSPAHPIGMCFEFYGGDGDDPLLPGPVSSCIRGYGCDPASESCFVFAVPGQLFQQYASNAGMCLPHAACIEAATKLPGGGGCFDNSGSLLAGSLGAAFDPRFCPQAGNPFFGSCLDPLLHGCWSPDGSGPCEDTGTTLAWQDGHVLERADSQWSLFSPDTAASCIEVAGDGPIGSWTRGDTTVTVAAEGPDAVRVTCPDASQFVASRAELDSYLRCRGVLCP